MVSSMAKLEMNIIIAERVCKILFLNQFISQRSICTNMDVVSLVAEVQMNIINVKRVC